MNNQLWMFEPYELKRDIFRREDIAKMLMTVRTSKLYPKNIHGDWMKARDLLILITMFEEGLRPKECTHLRFKDIDLKNKTIVVRQETNKTYKQRVIPICERIAPFLINYMQFPKWLWNKSEYIFPSFGNKKKPLSSGRWKHIFREKICKPSGLYKSPTRPCNARTTSYSLRHSKATEMLENSQDLDLVAHFLGHRDTRVTKAYTHFTKKRWNQLADSINAIG